MSSRIETAGLGPVTGRSRRLLPLVRWPCGQALAIALCTAALSPVAAQERMGDDVIAMAEIEQFATEAQDAHDVVQLLRPAWLPGHRVLVSVQDGPVWEDQEKLRGIPPPVVREIRCEWRGSGRDTTVVLSVFVDPEWPLPATLDPFVGHFRHSYFEFELQRSEQGYYGSLVTREWRAEVLAMRDDERLTGYFHVFGDRFEFTGEAGEDASTLTLLLPIVASMTQARRSFGQWQKRRYRVSRVR